MKYKKMFHFAYEVSYSIYRRKCIEKYRNSICKVINCYNFNYELNLNTKFSTQTNVLLDRCGKHMPNFVITGEKD